MKLDLKKKQNLVILITLVVGLILAVLIVSMDKAGSPDDSHDEHAESSHEGAEGGAEEAAQPQKGPHGGRIFTKGDYALEILIFEQGVEPQFRIYTYRSGEPLDPATSAVTVTLDRLGRKPQLIRFRKEADYLKGDAVVEEPHSFKVSIAATHAGSRYQFAFEQVESRVAMSAQQMKDNGVDLHTAGPAGIKSAIKTTGEIHVNEDRMVRVVPRLAGVVEFVAVNAGDRVRKGQVLAVIFSQALADQRSDALMAQKRLALARSVYERERMLWREKISAEQDYIQARTALQEAAIVAQSEQQKLGTLGAVSGAGNLTRYQLRATIDGTVTEKNIAAGQSVKEDAVVFEIADLSTVWAEVTVNAGDLNAVRPGQGATIHSPALAATATGSVSYVGAVVGDQTRSAKARVVLPNPAGTWRPGVAVNVELAAHEVQVPVAVLAEAIQTIRDEPVVFGRYGQFFEARPVELGQTDGKYVEVKKGLSAGEVYAAKNSFLIKADIGKAGASHDH